MLRIEWSARKNRGNIQKHGVDFAEAKTVFDDPLHLTTTDPDHSIGERRFITVGMSERNRLLIMAHTIEDDRIRIITARRPTRSERKDYEEGGFDA